jgi:hypothetical protein
MAGYFSLAIGPPVSLLGRPLTSEGFLPLVFHRQHVLHRYEGWEMHHALLVHLQWMQQRMYSADTIDER